MDLATAVESLAPLTGNPPEDSRRREAATMVNEALKTVGLRRRVSEAERDDAAQETLLKLVRNGPRRIFTRSGADAAGESVVDREAKARAYLAKCLFRKFLDSVRRVRPQTLADPSPEPAPAPAPVGLSLEVRELLSLLDSKVIPAAASALFAPGARERFLANVDEVLRLARRDCTMDELAIADARSAGAGAGAGGGADADAGADDPAALDAARTRLYQRHSRVLKRILEALDALEESRELTTDTAAALREIVDRYLRLHVPRREGAATRKAARR